MSQLFTPLQIGALTLENRILLAPMCQYSSHDGVANDWHRAHLGSFAMSGAGLVIAEATGVSPEGRISPRCLGLYDDATEAALTRLVQGVRAFSDTPLAIQLNHAGRKASGRPPFQGGAQIPSSDPEGWLTVGPSAIPHLPDDEPPLALDAAGMAEIRDQFVSSARRAHRAGFQGVELHMAHGYLMHQFLSPLANRREDAYGGPIENRLRFPLEVFDAVRAALPPEFPVWVRLSAIDWAEGGLEIGDAVAIAQALERAGCAALHVSSGGVSPTQQIPTSPGYQVHLATALKQATGLPTIAVGLITEPRQAEDIVANGQADAVALGRGMLWNPRWPWHAAAALGAKVTAPRQYWRSAPTGTTPPFHDFLHGHR